MPARLAERQPGLLLPSPGSEAAAEPKADIFRRNSRKQGCSSPRGAAPRAALRRARAESRQPGPGSLPPCAAVGAPSSPFQSAFATFPELFQCQEEKVTLWGQEALSFFPVQAQEEVLSFLNAVQLRLLLCGTVLLGAWRPEHKCSRILGTEGLSGCPVTLCYGSTQCHRGQEPRMGIHEVVPDRCKWSCVPHPWGCSWGWVLLKSPHSNYCCVDFFFSRPPHLEVDFSSAAAHFAAGA